MYVVKLKVGKDIIKLLLESGADLYHIESENLDGLELILSLIIPLPLCTPTSKTHAIVLADRTNIVRVVTCHECAC